MQLALEHFMRKLACITSHITLPPWISYPTRYPSIPISQDILPSSISYLSQYLASFLPCIPWYLTSQDIFHHLIPCFFDTLLSTYHDLSYIVPSISYLMLHCLFNVVPLKIFYLHNILSSISYLQEYIILRYPAVRYPSLDTSFLDTLPPSISFLPQYLDCFNTLLPSIPYFPRYVPLKIFYLLKYLASIIPCVI